jgi:oligopeptide transport system substrate-binding protein
VNLNRLRGGRTLGTAVAIVVIAAAGCAGGTTPESGDGDVEFSVAILEPAHLTPGWAAGGSTYWVAEALFAPLVRMAPDGSLENVHAESVTSDDQRVWTVTIKPDWTFHDGEVITAQHYVDTMNYAAYGPNTFGMNYQLSGIEGYAELNPAEGEPTATELAGLEVVDDTTFRVTLSGPDSEFPYRLSLVGGPFTALPSTAFDDLESYDEAPIGSGPFQMDGTWEHNSEISVTRYEEYEGPQPEADAISFRIYQAPDAAYTDLQAGSLDILGGAVAIPTGRFDQLEQDFGADHILVAAESTVHWFGLPINDPRFADVRVRQALSMAIDREGINEAIFGGLFTPSTGLYPPGFLGGGTDACGDYCTFDPVAAKELLDEAGGFEGQLAIYSAADQGLQEYFESVANGWRQALGIEAVLEPYPNAGAYFEAIGSMEGLQGPVTGAWGSVVPLPSYMLNGAFKCTSQYLFTSGGYCDEATDAKMVAASALPDDERVEAFAGIEQELSHELWTIPTLWAGNVYAFGDGVENVEPKPGTPFIDYLTVTPVG